MTSTDAVDPYAPPRSEVAEAIARVAVLAGPGIRLMAYLLDSFIMVAAIVLGFTSAAAASDGQLNVRRPEDIESLEPSLVLWIISPLLVWAIVQLVLLHVRGSTLGKLPFGLRILRRDGRRASLWRTFVLRWVVLATVSWVLNEYAYVVLGMALTLLVDPLMIFSAEHRTLHDRIAGTIVVRTR